MTTKVQKSKDVCVITVPVDIQLSVRNFRNKGYLNG